MRVSSFLAKRQKVRVFLLLVVLPSLFTYSHLRNWLLTNDCTSILHFPNDGDATQRGTKSRSILECKSKHVEMPSHPLASIVQLTEGMMQDVAVPRTTATVVEKTMLFPSQSLEVAPSASGGASNTVNNFGFRTNHKKSKYSKPASPLAFTTILLGAINIGLYWAYWNFRVDPSIIVFNAEITQDYGRAFSAAFGHFEIWHVGFNMMTLFTLGNILEEKLYGSIPFLMYTFAFVPLTALVIVGLQRAFRIAPSSMVGFSGILFAWSVVATLSTSQTCPIMFLPDLCFNTYHLFDGKLTISLGPLVQLVFLQVVLPRVSFVGHLSGIIVGFCWHWDLLPPLEVLQPCILYPILWIFGKLVVPRLSSDNSRAIGSGPSYNTIGANAMVFWLLGRLLVAMMFHCFLLLCNMGPWNSIFISEVLLILVLSSLVHSHIWFTAGSKEVNFGISGRAYVVLVAVAWMTDSMTVMGWVMFRQPVSAIIGTMIVVRWMLWYASLCLVCYAIEETNQTLPGSLWKQLCGWMILDSCQPVGSLCVDHAMGTMLPSSSESRSESRLATESQAVDEPALVSHVV